MELYSPGLASGKFFDRIIGQSHNVSFTFGGAHNTLNASGHDRWGDPALVKDGVEFVRNNFAATGILVAIGLLLVDTPRIRQASLRSGVYHDEKRCLKKMLSAFRSFYALFDENLLDADSAGRKQIAKLRTLHNSMTYDQLRLKRNPIRPPPLRPLTAETLAALRVDTAKIQVSPNVTRLLLDRTPGVTQFDMAAPLFFFSSLLTLVPRQLGADASDERGLRGFIHLWAVIGSILGIHDEFNSPLHIKDTVSQKRMLRELIIPGVKYMDERTITIPATALQVTAGTFMPIVRINAVFYFFMNHILEMEVPELEKSLTWYDKLIVWIGSFGTNVLYSSPILRVTANRLASAITPPVTNLYFALFEGT